MKYSLLSVSTPPSINIGDYIQALASRQYLPRVDSYIEREQLKDYNDGETNMIMNAYYMHDGKQWPPSKFINPLYVAVHINKLAQSQMLTKEGIEYFKRHEPIGCRDLETERVLRSHGINAYFSGCMTLTLGIKYKSEKKDHKVYFVDVQLPINGRIEKAELLLQSILNCDVIWTIAKKMSYTCHSARKRLNIWCKATKFYHTFKKIADKKLLLEAEYLTQEDEIYNHLPNNDERLLVAENLVKKYSQASLVITSRIHCALPCLAVETPVYYVYDDNMPEHSKCRLDGLVQMFNIIHWTGSELKSDIRCISLDNIVPNKKDYIQYARQLNKRCEDFINSCKIKENNESTLV